MSTENLKFLITAVLSIHGLGHGGAIGALIWRKFDGTAPVDQSGWLAARSWLFPSLDASAAMTIAMGFWIVAMIGFIATALSLWGVLAPGDAWRILAVVSAVVSSVGIVLFAGTWPAFNTVAAVSVDVAVLVTQLWLRWPERTVFAP